MHGPELSIVLGVCAVLAIGAAMRMLSKRVKVPYTAGMLLVGVAAGFTLRALDAQGGLPESLHTMVAEFGLSSASIMLVFLPALVFESAVSLDTYAFTKNLGVVLVLAVPALLVATLATAGMMTGLTGLAGWNWSFEVALVYGALISATDPVAVVALLRELGAPKRLGLMIEGESLLNDGTAIVVFTVLLAAVAGGAAHAAHGGAGGLAIGDAILDFLRVVGGGVGVGLLIALLFSWWLSHVYNDPLVEITLTIVMAYITMVICEGFLHVSGVIGIVTMGLYMAGPGKTRISPGVQAFRHRFWEMVAYLANTLIFTLAGFTIAREVQGAHWTDIGLLLAAWAGVLLIRAAIVFGFRPVMNRVSEPVSARQAAVMTWGGLRGAVSLALALLVTQHPGIDPATGMQILRATAGVVMLTIFVNGTTTGWLIRKLGLDRVSPAQRLARLGAEATVLERVAGRLDGLADSPHHHAVNWSTVHEEVLARLDSTRREMKTAQATLDQSGQTERAAALWQRALGIERQCYQGAYAEGTLGATALQVLELELDLHADRLEHGDLTPPGSRTVLVRRFWWPLLDRLRKAGLRSSRLSFAGDLALFYDLSRAEAWAARDVLDSIGTDGGSSDSPGEQERTGVDARAVAAVRDGYRNFLREAQERLGDLRVHMPEMVHGIERKMTRRIALNLEREAWHRLEHHGDVDDATAHEAEEIIDRRMKELRIGDDDLEIPTPIELCRATPLFRTLDEDALASLDQVLTEQVLSPGDVLFRQGDRGADLFIVARGALHVVVEEGDGRELQLDVLGAGDVVGEMALLTGEPRSATVRAGTTVIVGRVGRDALLSLMDAQPGFHNQVLRAFARHVFDNRMRNDPDCRWNHAARLRWIDAATLVALDDGEVLDTGDAAQAFVFAGALRLSAGQCKAPHLARADIVSGLPAVGRTHVALMTAAPPSAAADDVDENDTI